MKVSITPRCAGEIVAPVTFLSDAAEKQTLQCMVQYSARGPIVEPSSDVLKFPVARLLDHQQRVLTLTSKSLSDCTVTVGAARPGSFFTIPAECQKFLLRAGEQAEVPVVFCANTTGSHSDFLLIACELANPACEVSDEVKKQVASIVKVKVQGEAKGTSLVCPDQDLLSDTVLHWGSHYTTEVMVKELKIENHGADPQTLTWYQ